MPKHMTVNRLVRYNPSFFIFTYELVLIFVYIFYQFIYVNANPFSMQNNKTISPLVRYNPSLLLIYLFYLFIQLLSNSFSFYKVMYYFDGNLNVANNIYSGK